MVDILWKFLKQRGPNKQVLWCLRSSRHEACQSDQQKNSGEKLSTFFLFQSISMAIQRGNAVCVMGCPKDKSTGPIQFSST